MAQMTSWPSLLLHGDSQIETSPFLSGSRAPSVQFLVEMSTYTASARVGQGVVEGEALRTTRGPQLIWQLHAATAATLRFPHGLLQVL